MSAVNTGLRRSARMPVKHRIGAPDVLGVALTLLCLELLPSLPGLRVVDPRDCLVQTRTVCLRQRIEDRAIERDGFKQGHRHLQPPVQGVCIRQGGDVGRIGGAGQGIVGAGQWTVVRGGKTPSLRGPAQSIPSFFSL